MSRFFKDKVIIITGSHMGIGKAIATECLKRGAKIVINGRNAERLQAAKAAFAEKGYEVLAVQADVTDYAQCQKLVEETIETYGKLDAIIPNASLSMESSFDKMEPDVFKRVMDSQIYGTVFPVKAALPYLKKTKGSVIIVSSAAGMFGFPDFSPYSAGKMSLTALAQSLKIEFSTFDVHVGIIYIGYTKNDSQKQILDAKGNLRPVGFRPAWIQQPQEKVANAILRLIEKRKTRKIMSPISKLNYFVAKYFPGFLSWILIKKRK